METGSEEARNATRTIRAAGRGEGMRRRRQDQPSWKDVLVFCIAAAAVVAIGCCLVIWQAHAW